MTAKSLSPASDRSTQESDVWSDWLLSRRHADDSDYGQVVESVVKSYAKKVLDGARLRPEMTVLDIGSGEGLVPFEAIRRVGRSLKVILTDISAPMLAYARGEARELEIEDQCSFVECPADHLIGIPSGSVDVVTTRAALAYVADKTAAYREIFRVLKPGGRLSSFEPIFADEALGAQNLRREVDRMGDTSDSSLLRLYHRYKSAQFPDTEEARMMNPIVNYSERDLFHLVQGAGFVDVYLEFTIDLTRSPVTSWDTLLGGAPHPLAPTLGEILERDFSAEEREFFEKSCRPSVEAGANFSIERNSLITAVKPAE